MTVARAFPSYRLALALLSAVLLALAVWSGNIARAQTPTPPLTPQEVVQAPGSIAELARSLKNDPDLIYQYVYNNIEYTPMFGSMKGPLGTLLDRRGDDFDQSALMVALLRQAGYTANYLYGQIQISPAQVANWLNVDNSFACTASTLLANGGIPVVTYTTDGTCQTPMAYIILSHVWVQATVNGTACVFDPSFKTRQYTSGINLASAMGYNQSAFLSSAEANTTITSTYIQNVNRANLRSSLTSYATNLTSYIKTSMPSAALADVIGGRKIVPFTGKLCQTSQPQTSLPYQAAGAAVTQWTQATGDIPVQYKTQVTLQMPGWSGASWTSDVLYGQRLMVIYNAANQPVLYLNGTQVPNAVGTAGTTQFTTMILHPDIAYIRNDNFTETTTQTFAASPGYAFFIVNGYDFTGPGMVDAHRRALLMNQMSGNSSTSEPVLGETLAVIAFSYVEQYGRIAQISDQLSGTTTQLFQAVGVMGQTGAPYFDLPGLTNTTTERENCTLSGTANYCFNFAEFFDETASASALEWGTITQSAGIGAASTVKLIDLANCQGTPCQSMPIYDANPATLSPSALSQLLSGLQNYGSSDMASVQNLVGLGWRVILPQSGNLTEGSFVGAGYIGLSPPYDAVGMFISPQQFGGEPETGQPQTATSTIVSTASALTVKLSSALTWMGTLSSEPIDLFTGNYLYDHDDLTIGSAAYPLGLGFHRSYNSGNRGVDGPLGLGWTHNLVGTATVGSDGMRGMSDSPIDSAAVIASLYTSLDVLNVAGVQSFSQLPLDRIVVASLIHRFMMDQLINNVVNVSTGSTAREFALLVDGTYNPPPAISDTLSPSSGTGGTYTYKTKQGVALSFNSSGNLATWTNPAGALVNFNYNGNQLASVSNNLGRSLSFAYDGSNRITAVTDGTGRQATYAYDGWGDLAFYTDASGNTTSFAYDLPGLLTQVTCPSFPSKPCVTNAYDTLDRVMTQANGNNSPTNNTTYTYYLAGYRSEEVDPYNNSHIIYNNALGSTTVDIDRLGNLTTTSYDGRDRPTGVTLPAGNSLAYTYADQADPLTMNIQTITATPAPGSSLAPNVQSFTYDPTFNKVTSATDPLGRVTTSTIDPTYGNLLSVTADSGAPPHLNATSIFTYNNVGQVLTSTDPLGIVTQFAYDGFGNPISVTKDAGAGHLNQLTSMAYDSVSNVISVTDPNGNVTSTSYDLMRRPIQVRSPPLPDVAIPGQTDVLVTGLTYDADDRVVQTQQSSIGTSGSVSVTTALSTTYATYTPSGQRATTSDANCNTTVYAYDLLDRVSQVTDPASRVTSFAYDAAGHLTQLLNTAGSAQPLEQYTYTPNGRPASFTDARGNVTTYTYDGFDRLARTTYPNASFEASTYDADGNVLTRQKRGGQVIAFTYDTLNRLVTKAPPAPTPTVSYSYDLDGRLTGTHDNSPTIANVAVPGGGGGVRYTSFYYYDARNRLSAVDWDTVNTPVVPTIGSVVFNHWVNNDNQRVYQTTTDNGYWDYPTTASGTTNYSANAVNQYTSAGGASLTYDGNGNLTFDGTFTYAYDAENRLISASGAGNSASYTYDSRGRRKSKTVNGTTTLFLWDGDREIMEYDGGTGNVLQRYVYGNGLDEALSIIDGAGNRSTPVPDVQGSRIALIDGPSGSVTKTGYLPFGQSADTTGAFRYTGRRIDAETNGLLYYRARMYSPVLGRFLQPDPIGYAGGRNLYAYVGNDPLNRIDPSGLVYDSVTNAASQGFTQQAQSEMWQAQVQTQYAGQDPFGYAMNMAAMIPIFAPEALEAVAAEGGVWDLNPFARGQSIEQTLGANLPGNFPVIDQFANGTATSIKSIDLTATSYQNTAALASKLNGYVDSVAGFNGANWAGVNIDAAQITARQLQLAIPQGSASAAQQAVINAAAARAQGMGVNFIVTPIP